MAWFYNLIIPKRVWCMYSVLKGLCIFNILTPFMSTQEKQEIKYFKKLYINSVNNVSFVMMDVSLSMTYAWHLFSLLQGVPFSPTVPETAPWRLSPPYTSRRLFQGWVLIFKTFGQSKRSLCGCWRKIILKQVIDYFPRHKESLSAFFFSFWWFKTWVVSNACGLHIFR